MVYHKNNFYNIFWKILSSKNIKRVFGLPGSPIDNLLSSKPKNIIWTNTGNEMSNGFMSQVYGQFENNVGYLFVTTGPGMATAISALEQAIYEGNPLIIVSPIESDARYGSFQNWDIKKIAKTLTKHVFHITNENNIISNIQNSYEVAKKYNTGVILLFETSVFTLKKYKIKELQISNKIVTNKNREITSSSLINILEKINLTDLLLVVGRLKYDEYKSLFNFIKVNNMPYVTTSKGRFSKNNCGINCGRIGSFGKHSANYALINATHLLVLGNISGLLNNPYKNRFSIIFEKNKIIYSLCHNKDHTIKSNYLYEMNIISPILDKLKICGNNDWCEKLQKSNNILKVDLPRISKLEKFIYIAWEVYRNNNLKIPVTSGVGNHWYGISKYMDVEEPNSFESSTVWASIGIGIANGIGIHYATGKHVWVFEGDGGTLFGSVDLLYLLNNLHLPITVTIYINHIYGAIFENYEIRSDKINDVVNVPDIPLINILPNCHKFNSEEKYFNYLNKYPLSEKVRFIIIIIPDKHHNSDIYEINIDKDYEYNLKNSKFDEILETKMIL